jgi:eukaryotic-like serine/threonine-protein kinase
MKECPSCRRFYPDTNRFCTDDGTKLEESVQNTADLEDGKAHRTIPPPSNPLAMRLSIIDAGDEGHRSRVIQGLVLDCGQQGMRIQTGTVETGQLNMIRDHTIAFKNKLDCEVDLPSGTIKFTGFAAWYRPAGDGMNWMVGVYIRDMLSADRRTYDQYLKNLADRSGGETAPAGGAA